MTPQKVNELKGIVDRIRSNMDGNPRLAKLDSKILGVVIGLNEHLGELTKAEAKDVNNYRKSAIERA